MNDTKMKQAHLEARQQMLNDGLNALTHGLYEATGEPPQATILIVHWPNDIMVSYAVVPAPPQTQMNALDKMMRHAAGVVAKIKGLIDAGRHSNGNGAT
jgi:hypothetical protein